MSDVVISVERLSKRYQLGNIGTGTFSRDINQWIARIRGKEDPYSTLDSIAARSTGNSDFWALQDIDFEVSRGDAVGIIGKNGAGKSTLLKILSRITKPTSGLIKVDGRIASLLEVGTGFHPDLTGRENIFLNGAILGMTKREIRKKLDEIIAFSGVERHIDTPVKRYSSGMHVRLAFAVAAHLEPEILIVDEVLAVGDLEFQKKCLGKMNEVTGEGRTVLFVSHNMAAVKELCSKGIVLKSGKVCVNGNMEEALKAYTDMSAINIRAEVVWQDLNIAPGGKDACITGVRLLTKDKNVSDTFAIDEEFFIEIDYVVKNSGSSFAGNFQIFTSTGIGVLSTANLPSITLGIDVNARSALGRGFYKSTVKVPGNFLNAGTYYINALILQDISGIAAMVREVVSFHIIDNSELKKEYSEGWLGVVRPKLEWHTSEQT